MKLNLASLIVTFGSTATFLAFGDTADKAAVNDPSAAVIDTTNKLRNEILIEAVIFEVTLNGPDDVQSICFGNSGAASHATVSPAQGMTSNAFTPLGATKDDFAPLLARLADNKQIRILQRPRIQTRDGVAASLFIGDSRYCSRPRQKEPGTREESQKHSLNEVLGVTLDVSPSITSDRTLQMHIAESIEKYAGSTNIASVGIVPITSRRESETDVTLADRHMLVLAGGIDNTQDKPARGVPILKDVPLLGGLFRNHPRKIQVETILALRATILSPKEAKANTEPGKI